MAIRKRGDRYQVRVRLGSGRRIERTLPAGAKRTDALAVEAEIRRRHLDALAGRDADRLIEEALQRWEPAARLMKSYRKDLQYRIKVLREEYTAGRRLDEIPDVAEQLKAAGLKAGAAPATINRYLSILRRLGNLAVRWGWTDRPLGQRVELLAGEVQRHRYLTGAEVDALVTACTDPEAADLILFAALTGLRRSEILRLTPDMIRDGHALLDAQTKSGKPRAVPLPPQAARIAQERLPWSVTAKTLRSAFEAARKAAGLPDVRFHDLRHTYASWLAQDGASMAMIRDLLGHASVQTTSRYAHLGRRDLIEATRRVGDRLGSETKRRKSA